MNIELLSTCGEVLSIIGLICSILIIVSFTFSKELRSHPGEIILLASIVDCVLFYIGFFIFHFMTDLIDDLNDQNIFSYIANLLNVLTGSIWDKHSLFELNFALSSTCFEITNIYYLFICLDVILTLRNPFYTPKKRCKIYHMIAFAFPLLVFFPIKLYGYGIYSLYVYIYI